MITRHEMFDPLLEALPAFRPQWEAFVACWQDNPIHTGSDPGDLPNYLLLGELADHLAGLLEAGRDEDVARVLAVCERWLLEGDDYVRTAATVGLIEDLQNVAQRRKIAEDRFTALLGPEGKHWWDKVNAFWNKGEHLVDERKMPLAERVAWKIGQQFNLANWRARKAESSGDE